AAPRPARENRAPLAALRRRRKRSQIEHGLVPWVVADLIVEHSASRLLANSRHIPEGAASAGCNRGALRISGDVAATRLAARHKMARQPAARPATAYGPWFTTAMSASPGGCDHERIPCDDGAAGGRGAARFWHGPGRTGVARLREDRRGARRERGQPERRGGREADEHGRRDGARLYGR